MRRNILLTALFLCMPVITLHAQEKKKPITAQATVTAELGCLHCDYGIGEACAVCLKLDKKTPIILAGKVTNQFKECRFDEKVVVIRGTLSLNKKKHIVLTADKGKFVDAKDKKADKKGTARVSGKPACGSCDLNLCDSCTLAVVNGKTPIILDGDLAVNNAATDGKQVMSIGRLYVDKRGLLRLFAAKVEMKK